MPVAVGARFQSQGGQSYRRSRLGQSSLCSGSRNAAFGDHVHGRRLRLLHLPRHQREIHRAGRRRAALRCVGAVRGPCRAGHVPSARLAASGPLSRRQPAGSCDPRARCCSARPSSISWRWKRCNSPKRHRSTSSGRWSSRRWPDPCSANGRAGGAGSPFSRALSACWSSRGPASASSRSATSTRFARCSRTVFYVIMTRRLAATETSESLLLYAALAPVVLLLPMLPFTEISVPQDAWHWLILLSLGVYGTIGHWFLIRAYRHRQRVGARALSLSADDLDDRCSAGSSSTSCRTSGRSRALPSSWRAASTSCIANTGCGCATARRRTPRTRRWQKSFDRLPIDGISGSLNSLKTAVREGDAGTEDQAVDHRRRAGRLDRHRFAGAARQSAGCRCDARPDQGPRPRHRLHLQPPRRQPAHVALGHRRRRRARHHEPVLRRDIALHRERTRPQPADLHPVQPLRPARKAAHLHRHAAATGRRRRDHVAGDRYAAAKTSSWRRRTACRPC